MNNLFINPYLFFIILEGKFVVWDYKNHQQFELEEKYINRLLEISQNPCSNSELDHELVEANLIGKEDKCKAWGWDCLSKIFHFGTQIKANELSDTNIENASSFSSAYIQLSEDTFSTTPPIFIEKKGEAIFLPEPDLTLFADSGFLSTLTKRKTCRTFYDEPLSLNVVSTLLFTTFGNFHSEQDEYKNLGFEKIGLRKTSPAGGGLHSCEAYLLVQNINGLKQGIYHYEAHNHKLTIINLMEMPLNIRELFCGQHFIEKISLGVFITSRFEKLWHKYPHSRAYRIALLDAGHLSQTFQLVATALNLNPWLSGAFIDDEITKLLKLEDVSEQPLFFVAAGTGPWSSLDPVTIKLGVDEST